MKKILVATTVLCSLAISGCAVRPKPLTGDDLSAFAEGAIARVTADQEPVTRAITLKEAIARALKYNLDYKVEELQHSLKIRDLDVFNSNLMPAVLADAGYSGRNSVNASNSQSASTGQTFLQNSYSQDRNDLAGDLNLNWNILDFGLSYIEAQQSADKVLIAREERRKVVNRIVSDVRSAYWRALSAQHLVSRLRGIENQVTRAISDSRQIYDLHETSPTAALTNERELLEIKHQAEQIEGDLIASKAQLAALMNLPPDTKYTVAKGVLPSRPKILRFPQSQLVRIALENRPELREVEYKERINEKEATAALLKMLPGLQLFAGPNFDTNSFLLHGSWLGWGAKASWNVVNLFRYPAVKAQVAAQQDLLNQRALAVTMAVMTQVYVSRLRYDHYIKEFRTTSQFLGVQGLIVRQIAAEAASSKISEQTLIREKMNFLVAEAKRDIAISNLQGAIGNIYQSIGLNPVPNDIDTSQPLHELMQEMDHSSLFKMMPGVSSS